MFVQLQTMRNARDLLHPKVTVLKVVKFKNNTTFHFFLFST